MRRDVECKIVLAVRLTLKIASLSALFSAASIVLSLMAGWNIPDSGQLIYEGRWRGDIDIFVVDIARNMTQNLTRHHAIDTRPVWSPDGRHIAFESTRGNEIKVFVMDSLGQQVRALLPPEWDYPHYQNNPRWSSDSQTVYFQSYFSPNAPLFSINLDGSGFARVDRRDAPPFTRPDMNPNRSLIMSYRNGKWGIYLYAADWRDMKQLTDNNIRFRDAPRWSPSFEEVAFVSSGVGETEIYVMNADGSNFRRVTNDGLIKTNLTWRPY